MEPEIPGNAGAVARLCAATGAPLHFIGRLGFALTHPAARRAGMDYWDHVDLTRHVTYDDFLETQQGRRIRPLSTRAGNLLWDCEFKEDDVLLFGPESRGLPDSVIQENADLAIRIPMAPEIRSLNLSTSAAISLFEALRQLRGGPGDGQR